MPLVIVNTSPLQYLHQADVLSILPQLYQRICIPEAVASEIAAGQRLHIPLPDIEHLSWIEKHSVRNKTVLPMIAGLGAGEREVLGLATELGDALVILDDNLARQTAKAAHIRCTGTLGVLLAAKKQGILPAIGIVLAALQDCGFRCTDAVKTHVLHLAGEASS